MYYIIYLYAEGKVLDTNIFCFVPKYILNADLALPHIGLGILQNAECKIIRQHKTHGLTSCRIEQQTSTHVFK